MMRRQRKARKCDPVSFENFVRVEMKSDIPEGDSDRIA
jgi:hypothetical protein